jgi:hypothetical protein
MISQKQKRRLTNRFLPSERKKEWKAAVAAASATTPLADGMTALAADGCEEC